MSMLKSNIALVLVVLGAVFTAPFAYALIGTPNYTTVADDYFNKVNLEQLRLACVDTIQAKYNESANLKYITFCCDNGSSYSGGNALCIISDDKPSSIYCGSGSDAYLQNSSTDNSNPFKNMVSYSCLLSWNANDEIYTAPANGCDPSNIYANLSWSRTYGIVTNYETILLTDNNSFLYKPLPPVTLPNTSYYEFDPMLTSYLGDNGFSVSSANLRNSNGDVTYELPIVTDYADLENGYSGLYLQRFSDDFFFHFRIARTPDISAAELADYWQDYLTITFSTGDSTEFNVIYGVEHPLPPSEGYINDTSFMPYIVNSRTLNAHAYFSTGTESNPVTTSGGEIILGELWRYTVTNPVSRVEIPDIYYAMNFKKLVGGEDVAGTDSDTYNNYKTTYYNNKYQLAIQGMTGYITGETSFIADYSRQMPDTTIEYNDDVTFDDAGLSSFFTRFWALGNGYFTTILLSVLAVAFAAYIIYGRNG